jgi:hypothetical protein
MAFVPILQQAMQSVRQVPSFVVSGQAVERRQVCFLFQHDRMLLPVRIIAFAASTALLLDGFRCSGGTLASLRHAYVAVRSYISIELQEYVDTGYFRNFRILGF